MKIVHLITSIEVGGAQRILCDIIAGMPEHQHHVIYFHEGPVEQELRMQNIKTERIVGALCSYDPIFFVRLMRALRAARPNIIHSVLWAANVCGRMLARILRIPLIASLHNMVDREDWVRTFGDRISLVCNNQVVAVSPLVAQSLRKRDRYIPGVRAEITEITNGIAYDRVKQVVDSKKITREHIGFSKDHFIIGSVGRLVPEKNYELLIAAFARFVQHVPHACLVLIGDGPLKNMLIAKIEALGLIHAVHIVSGVAAIEYYHLFDCFVLPSRYEGVSMALLEAMSCGIACVVGSFSDQHPVISLETGWVVPVEQGEGEASIKGLEDALYDITLNPQKSLKIAQKGQELIERQYNNRVMIGRYKALFEKIVLKG